MSSFRPLELTVECFVEKDGKYLMLRRHPNKRILPNVWIAPGGHQEFCEGLFHAARREIKEETGLEIENLRIRAVGIAHLKDISTEFCFHILTATWRSGELTADSSDGELVWLTPDEMLHLDNVLAELKVLIPLIFGQHETETLSVRAVYERGNELSEFVVES